MNYYLGLTLTGIISGIFGGLIGAGAEVLIVPLLTIFGIFKKLKMSIGTSLFMLLPPIGLFAALNYYKSGYVDIFAALFLGVVFTIFASLSTKFAIKLNQNYLRKIFAIFTIGAGIYILFSKEQH